jgi:hypothetical protein
MMANFLDTLSNREEKELYLKQGFTYKIDIDQSLLILAANQQRDQTFDQEQPERLICSNTKALVEVRSLTMKCSIEQRVFRLIINNSKR